MAKVIDETLHKIDASLQSPETAESLGSVATGYLAGAKAATSLGGATKPGFIAAENAAGTNAAGANPAPNYNINYNDERFKNIEAQKEAAIKKSNAAYDQMIGGTDSAYQGLIDEANRYAEEQKNLQNQQTEFTIDKIEQQKQFSQEDYEKEQQAAYVDWQKQSGRYGVNAEQMAAAGLQGTGYSESSQVAMYTAYQNRVAVARQSFERTNVEYDNMMKEARLANSSALAQIAHDTWLAKAEYNLEKFQYKNDLLQAKTDKEMQLDSEYYSRWKDVLAQQNYENEFAENVRQYEQTFRENKRQYDESMAWDKEKEANANSQWEKEFAESKRQYDESLAEDKRQYEKTFTENQRQYDETLAEDKRQYDESLAEDKRQYDETLAEDKRQFNKTNSSSSGNTKSSGSSSSSKSSISSNINKSKTASSSSDSSVKDNGVSTTDKNKKLTSTYETNIANSLMRNSSAENKAYWAEKVEQEYAAGNLTKAQRKHLLEVIG